MSYEQYVPDFEAVPGLQPSDANIVSLFSEHYVASSGNLSSAWVLRGEQQTL